jgi:very-short-patch-repair endonuclease
MKDKCSFGYEMADPIEYTLLKDFAIENRKKPTEEESILWDYLKGNVFGVHFRRQHIIGLFIADFACLSHKLIIEIDGKYHQLPDQQISDKERTEWLEQKGFKVMRFTNEQIINDTNKVLKSIQTYIIKELPVSV